MGFHRTLFWLQLYSCSDYNVENGVEGENIGQFKAAWELKIHKRIGIHAVLSRDVG